MKPFNLLLHNLARLTCIATFLLLSLSSCKEQGFETSELVVPKTTYTIDVNGGIIDIFLQSPTTPIFEIDQAATEWIKPYATKAAKLDILSFMVESNLTKQSRTATIILRNSTSTITVTIEQTTTENINAAPRITSFIFEADKNSKLLVQDVAGVIGEDNSIEVRIPHLLDSKMLWPTITFDGVEVKNKTGQDVVDFNEPQQYTVTNHKGDQQEYTVNLYTNNGIPIIYLETENGVEIIRSDYVRGTVRVDGNGTLPSLSISPMEIKGRGNSTWVQPKKPWKMKLETESEFLGMPSHRVWGFLANYLDKSFIRADVAFEMARNTDQLFSPKIEFAEVYLNKKLVGLYQITELIEVAPERLDIGDAGFLLEVDQIDRLDPDDVYFRTTIGTLFNIKDPKIAHSSEEYNWVKDYIAEAETVLLSDNFKDPVNGYAKYLDVQSYVDWYLVNEITKNPDSRMYSSCYMNVIKGSKIFMGPVWDFDIAFGARGDGELWNPEGLWTASGVWMKRLLQDPIFVEKVKTRFNEFYNNMALYENYINNTIDNISLAKVDDDRVWEVLYKSTWPNYIVWGSFINEVQFVKTWFNTRMEWMKNYYDTL